MDGEAWMEIVAEELMVKPERVRTLAGAAREVGRRLTAADLMALGAQGVLDQMVSSAAPPARQGAGRAHRPVWGHLRSWR